LFEKFNWQRSDRQDTDSTTSDCSDYGNFHDAVASATLPRSPSPECRSGTELIVAASNHDGAKENKGFENSRMEKTAPEYDRFAEEDAVDNWSDAEDSGGRGSTLQSRWGREADAASSEESEESDTAEEEGPGFSTESESDEDKGQDESATGFYMDAVSDKGELYESELLDHEDYEGIVTGSANEGEHEVIGMDVSGSSGEEDDSGEECCIFDAEMPVIFSSY
jgi:hypothetical protein